MGEWFLARGSEEAVDIRFLNAVFFIVKFALNGVQLVGATGSSNEVDARVLFGLSLIHI